MTDIRQQEEQAADTSRAEATKDGATRPVTTQRPGADTQRPGADIFPRLSGHESMDPSHPATSSDIEMILDIPVVLTVELGRTRMPIGQILQLAHGSVIELDALAGEPMDVLVNGCLIAQGEVVVVNDRFGIRLTDTVTPAERMRRLHRAR